jgi:polysaccharide lyase-like protein
MIRKNKAQMKISFNLIFAIILIVIFIAFGIFAMKKFVITQERVGAADFISNIEEEISNTLRQQNTAQQETFTVPNGVEEVCFKYQQPNSGNPTMYSVPEGIIEAWIEGVNWVETNPEGEALCIPVNDQGKISVSFSIDYEDGSVTIKDGKDFVSEELVGREGEYERPGDNSCGDSFEKDSNGFLIGGDNSAEELFPVEYKFIEKDENDYSNIVYIDSSDSLEDISWKSDTAYLFKRGETYIIRDYQQIIIPKTVSNVYLGPYGSGNEKPIIIGNSQDNGIFSIEAKNTYFRGLDIQNPLHTILYFRGNSEGGVVYECDIHNSGWIGVFFWSDGAKVMNNNIYDIYLDGIWGGSLEYIEVGYNHIYDVNTAWEEHGSDQSKAGGDALQFSNEDGYGVHSWWVHHNIFDRTNSGNKFGFIASGVDENFGILEYNIFKGPRTDGHGGASFFIGANSGESTSKGIIIRYNHFLGPSPHGIWNQVDNVIVEGNLFDGPDKAISNHGKKMQLSNNIFRNYDVCLEGKMNRYFGDTDCTDSCSSSGSSGTPGANSITDFSCEGIDSSKFNIAFCEDFEGFSLGPYTEERMKEDWDLVRGGAWAKDFVSINKDSSDLVNPSKVMRFKYPEGKLSWYTGGHWHHGIGEDYEELYVSYNVRLKPSWWWVMGSKMHGFAAYPYCEHDDSYGCNYNEGFSSLIMTRPDGRLVTYGSVHNQESGTPPSYGWDAYLHSGEWHTITIRAAMNDVGYNNGLIEGFIDGELVFQKRDLTLRELESIGIDVFRISTWFGGDTDQWKTVRDEWSEIDNIVMYSYKEGVEVPRGKTKSPSVRVLDLPNLVYTGENPASNTKFTVRAKGTASDGEYAGFNVLVNNNYVGRGTTSSEFQDFEFETDFLPEEIEFITIHFDKSGGDAQSGWKTFTFDSLEIQNKQYSWNAENVIYDRSNLDMRDTASPVQYLNNRGSYIFFFNKEVYEDLTGNSGGSIKALEGSSGSTGSSTITNMGDIDVIFSNDFEDNSLGIYNQYPEEWEEDWNLEWDWFKGNERVSIVEEDNTKAMKFIYPEGSVNGEGQGSRFYVDLPGEEGTYEELYLSYNIKFRPYFDFVKSGKIPAIGGGEDWTHSGAPYYDEGYRSGILWEGSHDARGRLGFYLYHHDLEYPSGEKRRWSDPYNSNEPYFVVNPGDERWISITIRVVVNSLNGPGENGNNDGVIEAYIDGKLMERWDGLRLRNVESTGIDWLKIYSQFGGIGDEFATNRNEWMLTDDYYIWKYSDEYLAEHPEVPRGRQSSPDGRTITVPGMKGNQFGSDSSGSTGNEEISDTHLEFMDSSTIYLSADFENTQTTDYLNSQDILNAYGTDNSYYGYAWAGFQTHEYTNYDKTNICVDDGENKYMQTISTKGTYYLCSGDYYDHGHGFQYRIDVNDRGYVEEKVAEAYHTILVRWNKVEEDSIYDSHGFKITGKHPGGGMNNEPTGGPEGWDSCGDGDDPCSGYAANLAFGNGHDGEFNVLKLYFTYYNMPTEYGQVAVFEDPNNPGSDWINDGYWHSITTYVKLNTFTDGYPNADGRFVGYLDGKKVAEINGAIMVREESDRYIEYLQNYHYFGGDSHDFDALREHRLDIDEDYMFMYKDGAREDNLLLPNWDLETNKPIFNGIVMDNEKGMAPK